MEEVLISIVVPVYNSEKYLNECIESILAQSYSNLEIIFVDDGSTDLSKEILYSYRKKDNRIIIIESTHQEGAGSGKARNIGLTHASGKYIQFLDSDDYFDKNMVSILYETSTKYNADIVLTDAKKIDCRNNKIQDYSDLLNQNLVSQNMVFSSYEKKDCLFQISNGTAWNMFLNKKFLSNKNITFQKIRYTDDNLFTYLSMAEAERMVFISTKSIKYRYLHAGSLTSGSLLYPEVIGMAGETIRKELEKRGIFKLFKDTFVKKYIPHAMIMLKQQIDSNVRNDIYEKTYYELKNRYWNSLNIDYYIQNIPDEIEYGRWKYNLIKIKELNAMEYRTLCRENVLFGGGVKLPKYVENKRIVIYGAGEYGKRVKEFLSKKNCCKIVGWVDTNYMELPKEIESPCELNSLEFDYIIIATVFYINIMSIKEFLFSMDIADNKIVLLLPNSIDEK